MRRTGASPGQLCRIDTLHLWPLSRRVSFIVWKDVSLHLRLKIEQLLLAHADQNHLVKNKEIKLAKNPVFNVQNKHIEIQQHFIKGKVQNGEISLRYYATQDQVANIFTKPLDKEKFENFKDMLGLMVNITIRKRG